MRIFRRTLTVVAVAAAGTLTFALPAWAHNADFTRDCTQVHLHLDNFQASDHTANVVDVLRDGTKIDTVTFHTRSIDKDYPQSPDQTVHYKAVWSQTGPDHASGEMKKTLEPVQDCDTKQPPPVHTATATPTQTKSAAPPKAPAPPTPSATASPTPTQAVEASKLANTGAGNTVPLLVIGAVLVAGGGALTFVTRRRRGQRASG